MSSTACARTIIDFSSPLTKLLRQELRWRSGGLQPDSRLDHLWAAQLSLTLLLYRSSLCHFLRPSLRVSSCSPPLKF
ncbi:hypothetical protein E2C01_053404 [Portunus trituberculatus]|uniref:Uncharacterized protein n=1 Tax=Portunus trituberculatus TaxID=210409 RepID=A0A5B7GPE0_PORTR|nr:hypothetical protein [Portunus trituberculatus]